MENTFFLAQFWGWLSLIAALIYLVRGQSFPEELVRMHRDRSFIFLSGWLLLLMGLVTLTLHNVWADDWRIIITLSGWAAALKGITRIGFPEATQKIVAAFFSKQIIYFRISMVALGLIGVWLLYASWS